MRIFAGFAGEGASSESGVVEIWRFSLHSFTVCISNILHTWPHDSFQVIRLSMTLGIFHGHWTVSHQISQKRCVIAYGKSYYRLLGNHTLAFDWCHSWWPWSTFEGHFSLGCHFHVHFSNPWHAFASHGLPAIAELLVVSAVVRIRRRCNWCLQARTLTATSYDDRSCSGHRFSTWPPPVRRRYHHVSLVHLTWTHGRQRTSDIGGPSLSFSRFPLPPFSLSSPPSTTGFTLLRLSPLFFLSS